MKIAIGCDENAVAMKEAIKEHLTTRGFSWEDFGCQAHEKILYPEIAHALAKSIASQEYERGILLCGTGLGMAIAANKVPGVRAATCHDMYSAERCRKSNDAQIITMGSQVIGLELAKKLVDVWLDSEFAGGRSKPKVDAIKELDELYRRLPE